MPSVLAAKAKMETRSLAEVSLSGENKVTVGVLVLEGTENHLQLCSFGNSDKDLCSLRARLKGNASFRISQTPKTPWTPHCLEVVSQLLRGQPRPFISRLTSLSARPSPSLPSWVLLTQLAAPPTPHPFQAGLPSLWGKNSGQADITVTLSPSPGNSLGAETGQTRPGAHYPSLNDSLASVGGLCPPGAGSGGARPTPAAWASQGPAWEVNQW